MGLAAELSKAVQGGAAASVQSLFLEATHETLVGDVGLTGNLTLQESLEPRMETWMVTALSLPYTTA